MARKDGKDRGLFQRKDRPDWWIRWTCPFGHAHQEKIGPKSQALQFYAQRKVAVKMQGFCLTQAREAQRTAQPVLFREVAQRYMDWAAAHRPRSLKFRRTAMTHLRAAFDPTPLAAITRTQVEAYLSQRRHEAGRPATVNRERAVLSHLFRLAQGWDVVESNPVVGSERFPEDNEKPRPLTHEEEARLCAAIATQHLPVITLALHTGLRLGELRAQRWSDVDLGQSALTVTRPKSTQHEVLPLNSTAFAVLAALPQDGPLLFATMPTNMSRTFVRAAHKAGIPDITFHCLRDTYISRLAPHCTTPVLMALARHRAYSTTRRYIQIEGVHLRQALEHLVPATEDATVTQTVTAPSPAA